ncbi:TetR family transcriptional regulator [Kribbella sp. ALI-6-A]|uniref:TetR/AcrR family transcriptional regulator n=1 Tax=Kribbella sp. ALI-6-A TaxID=1933817 RepID=UPI00097BDF31|nr:TetR family transcriptional regulator [Kribbella sp. ALI-6-A]ONI71615.1 TetR family transcriptional regulator [Kribbella sp. ALI-6-A]
MTFQRARSEEQRAERRRAILATATAMLAEQPVAELTLNELSRRVGLAKSNVLNYFESREAVLLELMNTETAAWLTDFEAALEGVDPSRTAAERAESLANTMTETLTARPMLCELISAQAAVLERNISTDVALNFKRAAVGHAQRMTAAIVAAVPELGEQGAINFVASGALLAGAIWTHSRPPAAVLAAYEAAPELSALRVEFTPALRIALHGLLFGLLPR